MVDTAQSDLRSIIRREKDRTRLAELENAERNLREAKKIMKDSPSSSDFLLGMALKVIESYLPEKSVERRRYYLTEAISRFELAGRTSDAGVLAARLQRLPPPAEEAIESKETGPLPEGKPEMAVPVGKPAAPEPHENTFPALLRSGTVDDWLEKLEAQTEQGRRDIGETLSGNARYLPTTGYRSFLVACFESETDKGDLISFVEGTDKLTKRFVEILRELKEKGEIECFINDSPLDYAVKALDIVAGVKEGEGENPKRGTWEFQLSDGNTVAVTSSVNKDASTGRVEGYVFRLESRLKG